MNDFFRGLNNSNPLPLSSFLTSNVISNFFTSSKHKILEVIFSTNYQWRTFYISILSYLVGASCCSRFACNSASFSDCSVSILLREIHCCQEPYEIMYSRRFQLAGHFFHVSVRKSTLSDKRPKKLLY